MVTSLCLQGGRFLSPKRPPCLNGGHFFSFFFHYFLLKATLQQWCPQCHNDHCFMLFVFKTAALPSRRPLFCCFVFSSFFVEGNIATMAIARKSAVPRRAAVARKVVVSRNVTISRTAAVGKWQLLCHTCSCCFKNSSYSMLVNDLRQS
jgi:hypothetical protein